MDSRGFRFHCTASTIGLNGLLIFINRNGNDGGCCRVVRLQDASRNPSKVATFDINMIRRVDRCFSCCCMSTGTCHLWLACVAGTDGSILRTAVAKRMLSQRTIDVYLCVPFSSVPVLRCFASSFGSANKSCNTNKLTNKLHVQPSMMI